MSHQSKVIHLATGIDSYFEDEIGRTAQKQGIELSPFAARYLAKMLTRFTDTRSYLIQGSEENAKQSFPKLATLWLEGLSKTLNEQMHQFQFMGDVALFTSGFFSERIQHSLVDMDYYIAMGGKAYERAAHLRNSLQAERDLNIFFELSNTFTGIVEVLGEISDQSLLGSDKDLLRLYEKWLSTGSDRVKRMLAENGILSAHAAPQNPDVKLASGDGDN